MDARAFSVPISILVKQSADGNLFPPDMGTPISSQSSVHSIALAIRDPSPLNGRMRAWIANGALRMPWPLYGAPTLPHLLLLLMQHLAEVKQLVRHEQHKPTSTVNLRVSAL